MGTLGQDIRFGARMLARQPGFTLVAVLTLALGIGVNTAIFSVVNGVLLRPLPFPEPHQLVNVWEKDTKGNIMSVAGPNFWDWQEQSKSFKSMSLLSCGTVAVLGGDEPQRTPVCRVSRDFFSLLAVGPVTGRTFTPEEKRYDGTPEAVVSYGFWHRALAGTPDFGNRLLEIYGRKVSVIGAMAPNFNFPPGADVWIANNIFPPPTTPPSRTAHNYAVIGRLKTGTSPQQAVAELDLLQQRLYRQHAGDIDAVDVAVVGLQEQMVGGVRTALLVLMGAAGFVLLLACANVANLLLVRMASRQREIAVRTVLGAGRPRLVRQLLVENLLLSLVGGLLGSLLAAWLLPLLLLFDPGTIPRLHEVTVNGTVLAAALLTCVLTAVLLAVAPALHLRRLDLNTSLKEGGRGAGGQHGRSRLRNLLVVSEVGLALVLLVGAGLLTNSLWHILSVPPGFDPENVLVLQTNLPTDRYPGTPERWGFFAELLHKLEGLPGVESAGLISHLPMYGGTPNGTFFIEGRPAERGYSDYRIVSPHYFRTMEIPLLQGRFFNERDTRRSPHVALVNQSLARRFWPNESPVGKRIQSIGFENDESLWSRWVTIVGVVGDVKQRGLDQRTRPELYVPMAQRSGFPEWTTNVVIRTSAQPPGLIAAVREQVRALDPNLAVDFRTMEGVLENSYAGQRFNMLLLGGFAVLGLVLAGIGVYGVVSFGVTQRTGEIGIRMALGAGPGDVFHRIIGEGLKLALLGLGVGLLASLALARLLAALLFGITPTNAATYAGVSLLLMVVVLLACYLPARRATRVDPMVALRYE